MKFLGAWNIRCEFSTSALFIEIISVLSANVTHNPKGQSALQQLTVSAVHPRGCVCAFKAEVAQNRQTIPGCRWCRLSCAKDLISLSRWFSFFWAPHYRSARCSQAFASGEGPEQDTHMPTDQSRIAAAWQSPFLLQGLAGGARGKQDERTPAGGALHD